MNGHPVVRGLDAASAAVKTDGDGRLIGAKLAGKAKDGPLGYAGEFLDGGRCILLQDEAAEPKVR